jgi:AhpC/TSA family protein
MSEPLGTRLARYVEWLASSSPDFSSAYQSFVERLSSAEFGLRGPQVGDTFPSFMLPDQDGRLVCLENLLAERPLVLSFNRGHWCSLCKIELDALNQARSDIEAAGGSLVAIIPEPQIMSRKIRAEIPLNFPVLPTWTWPLRQAWISPSIWERSCGGSTWQAASTLAPIS